MAKKCIIYVATVVNAGDNRWASLNSKAMEPVKVEEREPIGKDPEFCCPDLNKEMNDFRISFYFRQDEECGLRISDFHPGKSINFCPFCGAKIVFKEHLKLKVIETPITRHLYHYEVVK